MNNFIGIKQIGFPQVTYLGALRRFTVTSAIDTKTHEADMQTIKSYLKSRNMGEIECYRKYFNEK